MISKQSSVIISARDPSMLNKSAFSSKSLNVDKSNRKFLVFCAFLLTLILLGASLQSVPSCLPSYDQGAHYKAFIRKRFFTVNAVSRVRTEELRFADVYRDEALHCDRSHFRTDVCVAKGDVRVLGAALAGSYQVLVFADEGLERVEKLKPYTRKWEESVMRTIDEVTLIRKVTVNRSSSAHTKPPPYETGIINFLQQTKEPVKAFHQSARLRRALLVARNKAQKGQSSTQKRKKGARMRRTDPSGNDQQPQNLQQSSLEQKAVAAAHTTSGAEMPAPSRAYYHSTECEVRHEVPAIVFSTGGYTGNVYHEFNDGLIPLFITAQKYRPLGRVVLIVLEYHTWWMSKYAEVVAQISNHTLIDLAHDKRVHCFPEVTVGLRIHDELAIHAENSDHASIQGFQSMLSAAYDPRGYKEEKRAGRGNKRRKLLLMSRKSPRALLNEQEVISLAKEIGFSVQVLRPSQRTRMADIYKAVSRCDVMLGVHGAAMTHLLFMKPGATFIQVVPLGTDWAAATYYGEPAQKLGLNYVAYKVSPQESSLSQRYASDDPVLVRPESVNQKGWWETKRIYLGSQDITVSLTRMRVTLLSAYTHAAAALRLTAS